MPNPTSSPKASAIPWLLVALLALAAPAWTCGGSSDEQTAEQASADGGALERQEAIADGAAEPAPDGTGGDGPAPDSREPVDMAGPDRTSTDTPGTEVGKDQGRDQGSEPGIEPPIDAGPDTVALDSLPEAARPEVIPEPGPLNLPRGCYGNVCRFDDNCPTGQYCTAGLCSAKPDCPTGSTCQCQQDRDCPWGSRCDKGKCEKINCSRCTGPQCADDCLCPKNSQCAADGTCTRCAATCASDSDCGVDSLCQGYGFGCTGCFAKGRLAFGEACRFDSQCKSGLCKLGSPAGTVGVCTDFCSKDADCPGTGYRCQDFTASHCNMSRCKVCTKGGSCGSLWSCGSHADCKNLVTNCSCCNDWRCNRNGRCHLAWPF